MKSSYYMNPFAFLELLVQNATNLRFLWVSLSPFTRSVFNNMCFPDQLLSSDETRPSRPDRSHHKRRKVSFAPATSVYETPQVAVVDDELVVGTWYQAGDYSTFERERRETIVALQRLPVSDLDPEQYSIRGLEQKLTRKQVLERKFKSLQCKRAVLEQQKLQKSLGYFNPEILEETSRLFSKEATHRARQRAITMEADSKC